MSSGERVALYVALKSLDRLTVFLEGKGIVVAAVFTAVLDQAWRWLAEGEKVTLEGVEKAIRKTVVDEQGATTENILLNMYLYALSDLIEYFKEVDSASLGCVEEAVIDFYDFYVAHVNLAGLGGQAIVLDSAQENTLKQDPVFAGELSMLSVDRTMAENQLDWTRIESRR